MAAWRALKSHGKHNKAKEWSIKFECETDAPDTDFASAVWEDGMRRQIPQVSVKKAKEIELAKGGVKSSTSFPAPIELKHAIKHTRIVVQVAPQKDRNMIVTMKEQGRQKAMVVCKWWCEKEDDDENMVMYKALEFLAKLAGDYANDIIREADIKSVRNTRLSEQDISMHSKKVLKKPAAQVADETEIAADRSRAQSTQDVVKHDSAKSADDAEKNAEPAAIDEAAPAVDDHSSDASSSTWHDGDTMWTELVAKAARL